MRKVSLRSALLAGASLAVMTVPAAAQLDEIVVTAEKRTTNLQETPIAITAISSDTLEMQQVVDVTDLSGMAPSLTVKPGTTNPTAAVVAIRGISISGDEMMTQDTPNGLYIDGVLISKSTASALTVADIEQVDILRGPQGTLFGRNSIGGAVAFKTRRPGDEAGGKIKLGYGQQGREEVSLSYDTGEIIDNVRASISIGNSKEGGYVDNALEVDDMKDPGAYDNTAGRVGITADLSDKLSMYLTHDWMESDSYAHAYQTMAFRADVGAAVGNMATTAGCENTASTQRRSIVCLQDNGLLTNETSGTMLELEYDLGFATLRSITSVREWDNVVSESDIDGFGALTGPFPYNADGVGGSLYTASNVKSHEQTSQELALISNGGDIDWVVGMYYLEEEASEDGQEYIWLQYGFPAVNIPANAVIPGGIEYTTESDSTALFGQATKEIAENLNLTVGVRMTEDTRSMVSARPAAAAQDVEADFDAPTGHITLDYAYSDNINTYVKVARGYRSGGFNARAQQAQDAFNEEIATSFEAGVKTESADRRHRLNAAVFSTDYDDKQVTQPVASGGGYSTQIVNASTQTITGVELEYQGMLSDNVSAQFGAGYIDVETEGFFHNLGTAQSPNITDISDDLLTVLPRKTLNAALVYKNATALGNMTARVDATFESIAHSFSNPYSNTFARTLASDAHTLVNVQVRFDEFAGQENLYAMLYGTNLTDEEYVVRAIDFQTLGHGGGYFNKPTHWGVTLGYSF